MTAGTSKLLQLITAGQVTAANATSHIERAGGASLVMIELFRELVSGVGGGPPTGGAGGVLGGSYPNPGFAVDMATQAELDNVALLKANLAGDNTFTGIQTINRTTGATGLLLDAQVNGVTKASIDVNGGINFGPSGGCLTGGLGAAGVLFGRIGSANPSTLTGYVAYIGDYNGKTLTMTGDGAFAFASGTTNLWSDRDTLLRRGGAATLQLGENSATPLSQRFKGPNGSGTNVVGGDLRLSPGQSTGSATPAIVSLQGTSSGASGAGAQGYVDVLSIIRQGVVRITGIPTSPSGLSAGDIWSDGGTLKII